MKTAVLSFILLIGITSASYSENLPITPAPKDARVYIIGPRDGAKVKSPVLVQFGLQGMGVAPAGVDNPKAGHHHLLINTELKNPSQPIPSDKNHIHFGGGQTETLLDLKPGKHSLQLIMGNHLHIPYNPVVKSKKINIQVVK